MLIIVKMVDSYRAWEGAECMEKGEGFEDAVGTGLGKGVGDGDCGGISEPWIKGNGEDTRIDVLVEWKDTGYKFLDH